MREKIIAGNWKMNCNISETVELISSLKEKVSSIELSCKVIVFPAFTSIYLVNQMLGDSDIKLGAQNVYYQKSGAFTGEISCDMLNSSGCEYVIVGHSERRTLFAESDDEISKKVEAATSSGLNTILCVGESLVQKEEGSTDEFIAAQIKSALSLVKNHDKIAIAYEPIWAIGAGTAASSDEAQKVACHIRGVLSELFGEKASNEIPILYGGSVKADNIKGFMDQKDIDGALIGGASLKADDFANIIRAIN